MSFLPTDSDQACLVGRVWRPNVAGPSVVTIRAGRVIDITSKALPLVRDIIEADDPAGLVRAADGEDIGAVEDIADATWRGEAATDKIRFLAPVDLQAIKACGVTFAQSIIERVIEEKAKGDPARADALRLRCSDIIGGALTSVKPGSEEAAKVKEALIAEGMWSQYLEVGIGPDAEVFSKSQVLSAVGWGADVGLHPISKWNNPEPEVVLSVSSTGAIKGAMLGNDVNLRDVEGRSALLLGKAKDNNASCALGPFLRLFDDTFTLDTVRQAELTLTVTGDDGFELNGSSSMAQISRDPADLVRQAMGPHHQYPDGIVLFLGTLFAPIQDRKAPGAGFTHDRGDVVTIGEPHLGSLKNTVQLSTECVPWTFGISALMRNLAHRDLL